MSLRVKQRTSGLSKLFGKIGHVILLLHLKEEFHTQNAKDLKLFYKAIRGGLIKLTRRVLQDLLNSLSLNVNRLRHLNRFI